MLPASMRNIGRVLGGEVKNEPIPWQVSIGQRIGGYGDYEHICGGAILDMHTVITAAQCIAFRNTYEMFVLAGTSSLNTTIKPIQIKGNRNSKNNEIINSDYGIIKNLIV